MAVEDRDEPVPDVPSAVEPDEAKEPEEDPNEEGMEEHTKEEEGAEGINGTAEARAVGPGDDAAAAVESVVVTKERGDEETGLVIAIREVGDQEAGAERMEEEPEEVMEADEEPEEAVEEDEEVEDEEPEGAVEEPEDEEAEGAVEEPEEAEGADEDEGMEEEDAEVCEEGATVDDMNEIADEEPEEAQDEGKHGDNVKHEVADRMGNDENASRHENDDPPNVELNTSLLVLDSVPDGNDKNLEMFVGGLPKDCIEEDITVVFSQCGEIESVRIVKNPATKRHKGIAFVRYADMDAAMKALAEFKDGIKVKGKKVRVSVARPPGESSGKPLMKVKTVYLEYVPRSWDESDIEECCQGYGKIQNVHLLRSNKKKISFVEFSSRKCALACVEGINNADISDGEVKLAASLARPPRKVQLAHKSHKGGFKVNSGATSKGADISEMKKDKTEDIIVKKKSQRKLLKGDESKLPSQGDVEVPQTSTRSKGKTKVGKRQNTSVNERPSKKARKICDESKLPFQGDAEVPQTSTASKGKGKVGKSKNASINERPSKNTWKNRDGSKLPSQGDVEVPQTTNRSKGKRKVQKSINTTVNERPVKKAGKSRNMRHPAGPQYATNNQAYPIVGATSRSKPHAHDLEPHAGFIPAANRVQRTHPHDHRRTAPYNTHQISGFPYARERAAPQPAYYFHTSNAAGYEAGYAYTYLPHHHLRQVAHTSLEHTTD